MTTVLMSEEKYMREAIKQAHKAAALGEVPIGCVIEYEGKIIVDITGVRPIRIHCHMLSLMRYVRHQKRWETGAWKNVPCTLH